MSPREQLEARAKELGVSFAPNIGDEKLQAKVDAEEARLKTAEQAKSAPKTTSKRKSKAKPDPAETDLYTVLDRVNHNGEAYDIDDVIELNAKEHAELAAAGVVSLTNDEE